MSTFITAFTIIFVAAFPGRTTFILATLAARGSWRQILIGSSAAFFIQSLISVLLGQVLSFVPKSALAIAAGSLFLFFSYKFYKDNSPSGTIAPPINSVRSVFMLIFLAEWGDVSQLAIASVAANYKSPAMVFCTAVTALWLITLIALGAGRTLGHILNPNIVRIVATALFACIGCYLTFRGLKLAF